jgi:hypothetical protein
VRDLLFSWAAGKSRFLTPFKKRTGFGMTGFFDGVVEVSSKELPGEFKSPASLRSSGGAEGSFYTR